MDRGEIEARARAEARRRAELARAPSLEAELAELTRSASIARRLAAALAGSRLAGLLAGDRSLSAGTANDVECQAAELRRRRFRLTRRKRVLAGRAAGSRSVKTGPEEAGALGPPGGGRDAARVHGRSELGPPSFCIRIAGRDCEAAEQGGDAALARSLARALGERGHEAIVRAAGEGEDALAESMDVLLALRGRPAGEPDPGRLNLIWQISHPDETDAEELNRYDRVLVASPRHAVTLSGRVEVPVEPLQQFADPELFHPAAPIEPQHDLLFVGNWRGEFRQIVWDAIQAERPPALYGEGWDLLALEHAVAPYVPHDELHRLYSSCAILLVDHWEDMRRLGFVSNKVFDALACGAFVIADDNPGLADAVPGGVETYRSPEELREKIDRYLADPTARQRIARRGREIVLAEHTADRRAERLIAIASAASGGREGDGSAAAAASREAGEVPK